MKKLIIIFAALFVTTCTFAQQKVGYLNSTDIIEAMPEYKTMSELLEKKKADYAKVLENMYTEYDAKTKKLQAASDSMPKMIRDMKMEELQDMEKRMNDFQQKAQKDLQTYAQQISVPLQSKFHEIVKQVAKEQGFSYIFDLASNAVPFVPDGTGADISEAVRIKLGATGPSLRKTPPSGPSSPRK